MSTRPSRTSTTARRVVAGLVPHSNPEDVARAALAEAERRGCRVAFVQVLPPGLGTDDRADADLVTFDAAVEAVRGRGRVTFSFETAEGDPAEVLLERSRGAQALVVGEDLAVTGARVARDCAEHATCDVVTVPRRTGSGRRPTGIPG